MPVPDPLQYIRLAEELDEISWRIRNLTKALEFKGVYDASAEGLGRLLEPGQDGKMIGVTNFSALVGKSVAAGGGLNGVVQFLPMNEVAQTLLNLYQARDQAKQNRVRDIRHKQISCAARSIHAKRRASPGSRRNSPHRDSTSAVGKLSD